MGRVKGLGRKTDRAQYSHMSSSVPFVFTWKEAHSVQRGLLPGKYVEGYSPRAFPVQREGSPTSRSLYAFSLFKI